MNAIVTGKRKREVGLVVPARSKCFTSSLKQAKILFQELENRKQKHSYLELEIDEFAESKKVKLL